MIKKLADIFFEWYCHPDYYPDIKGDLEELYHRNLETKPKLAKWKFLLQVLGLFRPSLLKPIGQNSLIYPGMLKSHLKISFRNLIKHKLFTAINIVGLTIGLSAFLLINEYVAFEKSYDGFHENADQLYRVSTIELVDGVPETKDAMATYPLAKALSEVAPDVLNTTVSLKMGQVAFRKGESVIYEKGVVTADSNFLQMFTYKVLDGSPEAMLNDPYTLVLTREKAESYFGNENPVGKTLEVLGEFGKPFTVTGVIEDVPENTHYKFDILMSDKSIKDRFDYNNWYWNNYYLYLKLAPNFDRPGLEEMLTDICKKQFGENAGGESNSVFDLHPVQTIHLESDFASEPDTPGNEKAVSFIGLIAVFILIIAWINYINLSTARAADRAKEVGLRKVIGAQRSHVVMQFLMESFLINAFAAGIALVVSEAMLPYFNQLVGKEMLVHVWNHPHFLWSLLAFFGIGTLVSGLYPAFVLSAFKPVEVLKGKFRNSKKGIALRKGLVILQFATTIALIASTFIVNRQVQYMQGKDLGISTDFVVGFEMPGVEKSQIKAQRIKVNAFKEALRGHTAIQSVGGTSNLPGGGTSDINSTTSQIGIVGHPVEVEGTTYFQFNDDQFLETVGMKLLAGRDFEGDRKMDSATVIVNESFLKRLNVTDFESVVNKEIQIKQSTGSNRYRIIGIVKNYNRTSLKNTVEPSIYFPLMRPLKMALKLTPENYQEGLAFLQASWGEYFPNAPLDYIFLDDRFAQLYDQDRRFGKTFGVFSALAILIATLGLFGLVAFMSAQRTKEVGIRKVLGASVWSIERLFFKDFLTLLGIAAVIGFPLVYFGMSSWLENYAFRIDFPWLLVVAALGIVVIFALGTIGFQVYKVAAMNPSRTLRSE